MLLSFSLSASAVEGLMPGISTYSLTADNIIDSQGVTTRRGVMYFSAGGYVEYGLSAPFNSASITLKYTASSDATITLTSANMTDTITLSASNAETTHTFSAVQRMGEYTLRISAESTVSLSGITMNKAPVTRPAMGIPLYRVSLSDYDETLLTSVLVDRNASVVLVNGGKRYIDYSDAALTADIIDGRMYLPAQTLARALGYYIEDYPARHYLLLRHERVEFCFTNALSYKEEYNGYTEATREDIENPIVYKNGKTYLPVRMFAEALGKTVGFRDGIAVIDDTYTVASIINDDGLFGYAKEMLSAFYPMDYAGKTYYVAQQNANASDEGENAGTKAQPFKTLAGAAAVAQAGDTVMIYGGTYRETLTPANSGEPTAPIVFQAVPGEEVVISALNEVSGFTAAGGGVYTAPVGWDLGRARNQVFYDGDMLNEARYPDGPLPAAGAGEEAFGSNWPVKGDMHVWTNPNSSNYVGSEYVVSNTLLNQEANYWKGGTFIGLYGHCYWLDGSEIYASAPGRLTIDKQTETGFDNAETFGSAYWGGWGWGYIVGHKNAMNTPGEWVIENGTLSIIPPDGADTNNLTFEVKKRQLVADFSGKSYIQLRGVTTIGGSMRLNGSTMCVVDGCDINYNNHFLLRSDNEGDDNITSGVSGMYVSGTGNAFVNNNIREAAGNGITATGTYHYFENNLIENCGYAGQGSGLSFIFEPGTKQTTLRGGHAIFGNTIARSGRCVLNHGGGGGEAGTERLGIVSYLPEEIAYNDFHDGFTTALDAGITYEYFVNMGVEKLKTRYHNNYAYSTHPKSNPFSFGLYHDGGAQSVDSYNNVIFTKQEGVRITSGGSNPSDTSVYTQTAEDSWADCDKWNNTSFVGITGGATALTAAHFPDGKPFYAGAKRGEDYLVNYNHIVNGAAKENNTVFAKDAVGYNVKCNTCKNK